MASDKNSLNWDLFITPGAILPTDPAPNTKETFWQPTSSTLIYGKRDAVLVDVPITRQQAVTLGLWVIDSGKNLKTIYITHGHGDHWMGTAVLLDRFPSVEVVATPGTVKIMRQTAAPEVAQIYNQLFQVQITDKLFVAEELRKGSTIDLEGNELRPVELGHSDGEETTCLYVPSIGLAVTGDVAYNGAHQYMVESTTSEKRNEWISALDKLESLNPRTVIAGHKRPGTDNDPRIIEETRQYIRDFDRIAEKTSTPRQLYDQMIDLYPNRFNPYILWLSSRAAKGENPY